MAGRRFRHEVAGFVLDSALELSEARRDASNGPACSFDVAPARLASATGGAWLSTQRHGDDIELRFGDMAVFAIDGALSRIVCTAASDVPMTTIRHLLLDHVVPRILELKGLLVLHASAVVTSAGAVGFMGPTGSGKSTLATLLAVSGLPLLSDDALVLEVGSEGMTARSTYPGFRLWPDDVPAVLGHHLAPGQAVAHYTEKRRFGPCDLAPSVFASASAPLFRAYLLEPTDGPAAIVRLTAREAFLALAQCTFRLDPQDNKRIERDFSRLSASVLSSCRRLKYRRAYDSFPAVRAAVIADVSAQSL